MANFVSCFDTLDTGGFLLLFGGVAWSIFGRFK